MGTEKRSRFKSDIFGQPEALLALLREGKAEAESAARALMKRCPRFVYLVGRGSSENVGRYAQYLLGEKLGIPVALGNPSLFTHYLRPPDLKEAAVIAISQSGQSPDICSVIEEGRRQGSLTVAITDNPDSPLGDAAQQVLAVRAKEGTVAATQTYSNSLAAISLLAVCIRGDKSIAAELEAAPEKMSDVLGRSDEIEEAARKWASGDRAFALGRGYNYGTAHEIALKLKEVCYLLAHPYSSAEFLHGPVAVVERGLPILLIAPKGAVSGEMPSLLERLDGCGATVLVITNDERLKKGKIIRIPDCKEWVSPLVTVVPGQLLALHICNLKGINPDRPRGLEKVTRTW